MLGLSQGSVSELLSKPKPWHMLSIKGREPFIRMQLWLNDPQNIEKITALKNEKKDPMKRKRPGGVLGGSGVDSNSDRSSPADPSDIYASSADSPGSSSAKKQRVLFSDEQKEALKIAFALDPYPSNAAMEFLSTELSLETRSITNWFHNHRMRLKQQLPQGMDSLAPLLTRGSNSDGQQNFDPVKFRLIFQQKMLEMQQGSGDDQPALSLSSVLLRQFGHAPLVNLTTGGGDLGALDQMLKAGGAELSGGGLDLSLKRAEDDKESITADESPQSEHDDEDVEAEREKARATLLAAAVAANNRSSRRKPAAPQWVRPADEDSKDAEENAPPSTNGDSMTINGVCVMNSYAFGSKNSGDNLLVNSKQSEEDKSAADSPPLKSSNAAAAAQQLTDVVDGES